MQKLNVAETTQETKKIELVVISNRVQSQLFRSVGKLPILPFCRAALQALHRRKYGVTHRIYVIYETQASVPGLFPVTGHIRDFERVRLFEGLQTDGEHEH